MRTRPILAAALAASLATACAAPKKEEVLNRPPAFDPVRATGDAPQVDATELSDDPAVRRKEILAGCYASTLMRGQVVSAGARTHVALLSASVSRGLLTARFAPPTHGDADMFEGCVANAIESGIFSIPDRGVFVTHAVEATRTPTNQGETTDVANMPRRVGGVPEDAWESAYLREADSIKGCADVTLSTSPSPDFGVLIELDVPPRVRAAPRASTRPGATPPPPSASACAAPPSASPSPSLARAATASCATSSPTPPATDPNVRPDRTSLHPDHTHVCR